MSLRFKASLLALAGKFDSVVLPAMSDSYHVIDREQCGDSANGNATRQNEGASFSLEERIFCNGSPSDECSDIAIAGEVPQRRSITAFASGTGLAGVVGYGYKALMSDVLGLGLSATVWSVTIFAAVYWFLYDQGLYKVERSTQNNASAHYQLGERHCNRTASPVTSEASLFVPEDELNPIHSSSQVGNAHGMHASAAGGLAHAERQCPDSLPAGPLNLTAREKCGVVFSLWPYAIPLFTVYMAEYMLQAGVWSAMGFPVTSAAARAQFYHYSNWTVSYLPHIFLRSSVLVLDPLTLLNGGTVPGGCLPVALLRERLCRLPPDAVVDAPASGGQPLLLLADLHTPFLVQLWPPPAVLLCGSSRRRRVCSR